MQIILDQTKLLIVHCKTDIVIFAWSISCLADLYRLLRHQQWAESLEHLEQGVEEPSHLLHLLAGASRQTYILYKQEGGGRGTISSTRLRVSYRNSVARNCSELRGIARNCTELHGMACIGISFISENQ